MNSPYAKNLQKKSFYAIFKVLKIFLIVMHCSTIPHVANVSHISTKKILNKKTTWLLERIFQALQNLTKREFLALFV